MTTDASALIAEWVRQEESFDNPASTVEYGRAQNWIRTNLSALLDGYIAALDEVERLKGNQTAAAIEQANDPDPFEDARIEELISIPVAIMSNEELGVLESECLSIGGGRGGRLRAALFELRRHRADLAALRTALTKLRADLNGTGWETEVDRILGAP